MLLGEERPFSRWLGAAHASSREMMSLAAVVIGVVESGCGEWPLRTLVNALVEGVGLNADTHQGEDSGF